MKMSAIFISEDDELYRTFRRALGELANIRLERCIGKLGKKDKVVIYPMKGREFSSWYCGEFRSKKKALNALIVIGTEDNESFLKQNPVFENYPDEHAYFQIPFSLRSFLDRISMLKPIYDQTTRRLMLTDFCHEYEYKLITHDLKIIKDNKNETIDNLSQVKDFYRSKGDAEVTKIIDDKIKEIQTKDDWLQVALEIKNYLKERLKGKA